MSEGPEVRRRAEELNDALAGETILEIEAHHRKLLEFLAHSPDRLIGHAIVRVYSIGKHILFELDNALYLHNHLLMFGSWQIYSARSRVPPDPDTMEIIRTERHKAVLHGGSVFEVLDAEGLSQHPSLSKLGPDALNPNFDPQRALANFRQHPDEEIAVALLDQQIIAGIGNYLKSEILYATRMDPRRRIRDISDAELEKIIHAARELTRYSFENEGVLVPAEVYARAAQGAPNNRYSKRFWVFRRTNKPCLNCGTPIRQFRQGKNRGRITYVCPNCQNINL